MARLRARNGAPDIDELEQRAEEQLRSVGRHVADLRHSVREEFDLRGRVEDGIHARPGTAYAAAAGGALIGGYILARLLKAEARPHGSQGRDATA
ncbi:MAG TPA: hypothetical protein VKU93_06215 [Terracidiphilus sp.]|jgi:hypothetical protein|nr:hypothetical protein [Terracidiphilus sp.]